MAKTRRNRQPEGAATPPPKQTSNPKTETLDSSVQERSPLSKAAREDGFLTMAEVAIGTLVIALLLATAVLTLRVTEKGTISQKKEQDALDLAKGKAEELKSYLTSQTWSNMQVDLRYPPVTPAATPYNSYSPTTVTMGKNQYILDSEVRYVYSDSASLLQYVPTPSNAATPEGNGQSLDMVRIRVDAYYGPLNQWVPLPTAEAVSNLANRVVYSNVLTNRYFTANSPSFINGHVFSYCSPAQPVKGALVGLYQGVQQLMTALTDQNGYFSFKNVPLGVWTVELVSAPGYDPIAGWSCSINNPVTLTSTGIPDIWLEADPIQVWNYTGVVVVSTPQVIPVPPGSFTPTPNPVPPTPVIVPVPNAVVFVNDGNSQPVTADNNGNFTVTQVRSTPVAGHPYDTIEADNLNASPASMGQNFNYGPPVGPITIYINGPVTGSQAVTFLVKDYDSDGPIGGGFLPITLTVADGSSSPPSTVLSASNPMTAALNVHQGVPNVSVTFTSNRNPQGYTCFNQPMSIGPGIVGTPQVLYNYAVGAVTGTVAGMGASFNYSQFQVIAQDTNNQFTYQIPVSYDGASTFGTFNSSTLRTPLNGVNDPLALNGDPTYIFSVNGGGNFTSSQVTQDIKFHTLNALDQPLMVTPLNVYMAVTVTQKGVSYPYGAWVSAQMWKGGTAPGALPVTQGNGYSGNPYFSTVTKGDGTNLFAVQVAGGSPTTYTVTAQIIDPTSYAVTQMAQTITMPVTATYSNPKGVSFGF